MQPGQDPTEPSVPPSLRRQQFLEYLQQQQLLIQQRERQTSNLCTGPPKSHSTESASWNPLLNLSSGLSATSRSLVQTEALPDNRWNEGCMQFEQDEDELVDDVKEEDDRPSGPASVLSLDDMPTTSEFIKKLYRMLDVGSPFYSVVCWSPSGDCFVVKDMQECTQSILPRLFKHSNFSSFVRQLNKYGFHKVKTSELSGQFGEHSWIFQHPDFRAGHPEALERIKRKPAAPRRNAADLSSALPTSSSLTSPSPPAPIVRPTIRRGSLSGPSQRLTPPAPARPFVDIDSELGERLTVLEQNHEGILNEMISLQQGLTERNDFIQSLIMRALQGSNSNMGPLGTSTDMSVANLGSVSGSGPISNFPSSRLELPVQPAEVPMPTIHYYQQQQQQPGPSSSSSSAATAGASFRVIRPALTDPGNVLPFSEQPLFSTSPSTSSFTATTTATSMSTHTRSQSRSHRRYSANDVEALGSSLGLGVGVGPASSASASASGSGSGLSAIPGSYAFDFNFNHIPGEAAAGRSVHPNAAEDMGEVDYPYGQ